MKLIRLLLTTLLAFLTIPLPAQVPGLINYQSRVAVGDINFDGTGAFKFALVNASGSTSYWTNDGTHLDGTEPNAAVSLPVVKGLYSVLLGDATLPNMQAVPAAVFLYPDVHLRVWFNDGIHGSQILTPDQRIAAVGYAAVTAYAGSAGTVYGDGSAGDHTAPDGESTLDVSNPQFNNFTVAAGRTLHVPSGLTIRCANSFTNAGTIIVDPAGGMIENGARNGFGIDGTVTVNRGIARTAPSHYTKRTGGEVAVYVPYIYGGKAYPSSQLKTIFSIGLEGGGTGYPARGYNSFSAVPALGGGALRIIARGVLSNTGTIGAIGQNGISASFNPIFHSAGGGGGGGVIILASATSLAQNGIVDVSGGSGGADAIYNDYDGVYSSGPGGAGGGGLIRLLSPQVISTGQNIVLAGGSQPALPAKYPGKITPGAASAGDGAGYGINGVFEDARDGIVLTDLCNPTALLGN